MSMMDFAISGFPYQLNQKKVPGRNSISGSRLRSQSVTSVISGRYPLPVKPPKDHWRWVVAFCSGLILAFTPAFLSSYGLVMNELVRFIPDTTYDQVAWIPGVAYGSFFIMGPMIGIVLATYSSRTIIIFCTVILAISHSVSAAFPGSKSLLISHGLISGIASSTSTYATVVIICAYFRKNRSTVTGLVFLGTTVGHIFFPPLIAHLFSCYTFQGSLLLLAGVCLQACVPACLLRPLKAHPILNEKNMLNLGNFKVPRKTSSAPSLEYLGRQVHPDGTIYISHNKDISERWQNLTREYRGSFSSESEDDSFEELRIPSNSSPQVNRKRTRTISFETSRTLPDIPEEHEEEEEEARRKRETEEEFIERLKQTMTDDMSDDDEDETNSDDSGLSFNYAPERRPNNKSQSDTDSLTLERWGRELEPKVTINPTKIMEKRSETSSSYPNIMLIIGGVAYFNPSSDDLYTSTKSVQKRTVVDYRIWNRPMIFLFLTVGICYTAVVLNFVLFLPTLCMERGMSTFGASLMLVCFACGNMFGRLVCLTGLGFRTSVKFLNLMVQLAMLLSLIGVASLKDEVAISVLVVVNGFGTGASSVLLSGLSLRYLQETYYPSSLPVQNFVQAVISILGPPCLGLMLESTGSCTAIFVIISVVQGIGLLLWLLESWIQLSN